MYSPLRLLLGAMACCALFSCNGDIPCSRTAGCMIVEVKLRSNDSLVLDTMRCSVSIYSQQFQDSLLQLSAPYADTNRYSIAMRDTNTTYNTINVKGKDVAQAQAQGYSCMFRK